jgi:hypothetical protein
MDHSEALKTMLQDIINDRNEQATAVMHDYFVSKTREVAGLSSPDVEPNFNDVNDVDDNDMDE